MPPPGNLNRPDIYRQRRWRRIQHLGNEFWLRWKKEFLNTLQSRQKWNDLDENIKVDNIVLLKTNDTNRNEWPMVRIAEKMPDKDASKDQLNYVLEARTILIRHSLSNHKTCFAC